MESKELVLLFGRLICLLGNQVSSKLIIKYYKEKPPLFQTLKDLLFIDLIKYVSNFCLIVMSTMIVNRLFLADQIPVPLALIIAYIMDVLKLLAAIKLLVFLVAKYLSIYHNPIGNVQLFQH